MSIGFLLFFGDFADDSLGSMAFGACFLQVLSVK